MGRCIYGRICTVGGLSERPEMRLPSSATNDNGKTTRYDLRNECLPRRFHVGLADRIPVPQHIVCLAKAGLAVQIVALHILNEETKIHLKFILATDVSH